MHDIYLQLTDEFYDQIQRRALEAGFANLDEYTVEVVTKDVSLESEDIEHRFTPKVMAHLNQIQEEMKTGAKALSEEELDEYLQERARLWRESHANRKFISRHIVAGTSQKPGMECSEVKLMATPDNINTVSNGLIGRVLDYLPDDYLTTKRDIEWLWRCDALLQGPPTNENILAATRAAVKANPTGHIDPYELIIDAGICDSYLNPMP